MSKFPSVALTTPPTKAEAKRGMMPHERIPTLAELPACKLASFIIRYVNGAKSGAFSGKASTLRYIGTMVGDVHRTLLYGGIFFYPKDKKDGKGKLRHLYECGPMAHTMSLAGGAASTGTEDVLVLQPSSIHGRIPIWIGSKLDVEDAERMYKEHP
jgi:fructose-1,6-bisphosphatase I